jgi:hypothetical protein
VDGTGPGLCPVAGFGISGVETVGSATREANELDSFFSLRELLPLTSINRCEIILMNNTVSLNKPSELFSILTSLIVLAWLHVIPQMSICVCMHELIYRVTFMSATGEFTESFPDDWRHKLIRMDRLYVHPLPCLSLVLL